MKNKLLLMIILCTVSIAFAQTAPQDRSVRGIVTDSASNQPVDFVTVNLKDTANQLVRTAATRQDGVFGFEKLPSGKYVLTLINIGYAPKSVAIDLTDAAKPALDLGSIPFTPQGIQLAGVVVTADKPIIKQEIDKLTYDLQADPESKSNSVLEMMRKVPMLAVDGEENIRLNGNTNYRIFINSKPSSMMESDPKNVLKSMPASTIQSIEVMTNPPARYDAEGLGGIINIVTIKRTSNGYNGTANASYRGPVSAGPGAGATLSLKQGRFGVNLNASGGLPDNPVFPSSVTRITTGASPTELSQVGYRDPIARYGSARAELSYEIDSLNLVSAQFSVNHGGSDIDFVQSSVLTGNTGIIEGYKLDNNNENQFGGKDAALNYQLGFRNNKARLLTLSYRFYEILSQQESDIRISDRTNYNLPDYRQYNKGKMYEQTFQIDYVQPIKKLTIEGGIKGIMRNNVSNFQYSSFNTARSNYETDPLRSNLFDNNQNVYGAYNSYAYNLKNWAFKAGVRIELTTIDADFISTSTQLKRNYFNVVPTVSMQRKFKDMSSMVLAFNQRINRPGISQLNPFVDRSNPDFESSGNPGLKPAVSNNIQLSYSRSGKASLTMMANYNFYNGVITQITAFNPATGATRSSYDNTGMAKWLTFSLNVNFPIIQGWTMGVNGQATQGYAQALVNGVPVRNEGLMYGASANTSYRFGKGWMVNANSSWNSASLSSQGTSNNYASWSLGATKDIVKDKLSFSASINNPFDNLRINVIESFGPGFTQINTNETPFRVYAITLNYRFGKLKEAIQRNKRGINNDDL